MQDDLEYLLGQTLAGFHLTHLLGAGGMAVVFRGENKLNRKLVRSIKIVRPWGKVTRIASPWPTSNIVRCSLPSPNRRATVGGATAIQRSNAAVTAAIAGRRRPSCPVMTVAANIV